MFRRRLKERKEKVTMKEIQTLHQQRIETFMKKAGQDVPASSTIPNEVVRKLRASLILEEALETIEALGFRISWGEIGWSTHLLTFDNLTLAPCPHRQKEGEIEIDIVKVIDGLCDLSVVTTGTFSAFGLKDASFLEEVDANNLLKIELGTKREDGKLLKPEGHPKPEIERVLETQHEGQNRPSFVVEQGSIEQFVLDRVGKLDERLSLLEDLHDKSKGTMCHGESKSIQGHVG